MHKTETRQIGRINRLEWGLTWGKVDDQTHLSLSLFMSIIALQHTPFCLSFPADWLRRYYPDKFKSYSPINRLRRILVFDSLVRHSCSKGCFFILLSFCLLTLPRRHMYYRHLHVLSKQVCSCSLVRKW